MVHTASSSIATSSRSRPSTTLTTDTGNFFQRFKALTVDDLFRELESTESQYIRDLESMLSVRLVKELLISHSALEPSLTKVLEWAEEAAPIYEQYVKEYVIDPDETEEIIYLKRRPLVRLRFYAKFFKKLEEFLPNVPNVPVPMTTYRTLVTSARAKVESEKLRVARLQIDFSRVRSFDDLQPVASWFNSQFISMRSYCQCHLSHRTGKTFSGLPVEILLVTEPLTSDALAVCSLHEFHRYLLFPTFRRADVVYGKGSRDSAISLTSYDGSTLELEFSSMENRNTWASKFQEIFPPAPVLPQSAQHIQANSKLEGLQISADSSQAAETDAIRLPAEILESELQCPRLFEEPDIQPFIITDSSPQKNKRHSLFKYGGMVANVASQKMHLPVSRISGDSKTASSSTSVSPYKRRQELLHKPSSVQRIVLAEEESPELKYQMAPIATQLKAIPFRTNEVVEESRDATSESISNTARECEALTMAEQSEPASGIRRPVNSETGHSLSTIQLVTPSRSSIMPLDSSSGASETQTLHSTVAIVQETVEDPSSVSVDDRRPKSSFSFARSKDYLLSGSSAVSRVSSVFRKISPRQMPAVNNASDTSNESARGVFNLRMLTSGKRHSMATASLSPVISDHSLPTNAFSEVNEDSSSKVQKRHSSVLPNKTFSRSIIRSNVSNTLPPVEEYGLTSNKSVKSSYMTEPRPVAAQENEKPKKFNVFTLSARRSRAALSPSSAKVQDGVDTDHTASMSTFAPLPSVEESVIDTVPQGSASEGLEIELQDGESKTEVLMPDITAAQRGNQSYLQTEIAPEINAAVKDSASLYPRTEERHYLADSSKNSAVKPLQLQQLSLGPERPLSHGDDVNVRNKEREVALTVDDTRHERDRMNGMDELIQEVATFSARSPSPSPPDTTIEAPLQLLALQGRVGTPPLSQVSRSSRSSRTSTVRDSKATLRAVEDTGLERYVLLDKPMSDSEDEFDEPDTYDMSGMKNKSLSFSPPSESEATDYNEEVELHRVPFNPVASLKIGQDASFRLKGLSPLSSAGSIVSAVTGDSLVSRESRSSSLSKNEYASSSISSVSVWDDCASVSDGATSVSVSATSPSPKLQNEDSKVVLFRSNALVYQWTAQSWDRICEKDVRVTVTVTEDSGTIDVRPITPGGSQSTVQSNTPSTSSSTSNGNRVHFNVGDKAWSSSKSDGSILTIPLDQHVNIRRSTAFDIHLKKAGIPGMTMFRTRTAIEADHMYNAINSCRLDFQGFRSRPFSSATPSIASSESSSHSSIGSSLIGGHASTWYHPLLESTDHSDNNFSDLRNTGLREVLLIKDLKCRLFLRQNTLKWRNLGPAMLSVNGVSDSGGNKVMVKRHDGQVVFDLVTGRSAFERVGRTGLAVHVMDELAEHAEDFTGGCSRIAVYMLQFSGEKDTNLVDRAIKQTV
ncbi:hypothetical protein V1509DRAFT_127171 [Lipomyces kononenkoae]